MSQQRKKYTPEYRREAANLVIESQRPIAHVAKEIGVSAGLLGRWVKNERERGLNDKMCCFPACRGKRHFVLVDCVV